MIIIVVEEKDVLKAVNFLKEFSPEVIQTAILEIPEMRRLLANNNNNNNNPEVKS